MTDGKLTQAKLFDVLSNARRRRTVRHLKEGTGSCDLAPLVEQVAAWENDLPRDDVTRTQRRRVYISLYQTHLPMLEDHGVVDWDPESHTIELLPDESVFEPYLDNRPDENRPWHRLYAVVAAVGLAGVAVSWLAIGPFTPSLAPLLALVLCAAFFAVSVAQRLSRTANVSIPFPAPLS
ncbi:hypothetical protein ACFQGT_11515 [Natrialbaceae archaeon GCM10025810]|uniref:DUF7344 domain-containing protein n=1 Tax=Halovalidus salilacus TaxID=3075124 RepID=UPI003607E527